MRLLKIFIAGLVSWFALGAIVLPGERGRVSARNQTAPAEDGVIPTNSQKIRQGTKLRGKCQPAAPYPHLAFDDKTSNPSSIAKPGEKHHVDSLTSEFFRLDANQQTDSMGQTRWAIGDTIEEMKNEIYKCGTTPNPLVLPPGRYRMVVTREVFDATFSNLTGWEDPAVSQRKITIENVDFEVVEPCATDDASATQNSDDCMNTNAVRDAFDRSFGARKVDPPPCYVQTQQNDPNLLKYQVRLGKENNILPTQDWVKTHVGNGDVSPQEGGRFMLLGAVQRVGDMFRVTMRIVNVETAVVVATSKGDGRGCPDGVQQAVENALSGLNAQLRPYSPKP